MLPRLKSKTEKGKNWKVGKLDKPLFLYFFLEWNDSIQSLVFVFWNLEFVLRFKVDLHADLAFNRNTIFYFRRPFWPFKNQSDCLL